MRRFPGVFLVAALVALAATSVPTPARADDKTVLGTGLGAALGGLLGSQFGRGDGRLAATGLGVFMGGVVGHSVGRSLDRADRAWYGGGYGTSYHSYAPTTYYYAHSYYEPTYVAPPAPPPHRVIYRPAPFIAYEETGTSTATEDYDVPASYGSRYCREYTQQVRIGNRIQESYGTACLQPDGSWQIEP